MVYTSGSSELHFATGLTLKLPFIDVSPAFVKMVTDLLGDDFTRMYNISDEEFPLVATRIGMRKEEVVTEWSRLSSLDFLVGKIDNPMLMAQTLFILQMVPIILGNYWKLEPCSDEFYVEFSKLGEADAEPAKVSDEDSEVGYNLTTKLITDAYEKYLDNSGEERTMLKDMSIVPERLLASLSEDKQKVLERLSQRLAEINGQDAYSVTVMSLGKLTKAEYLRVPKTLKRVLTKPSMVGRPWAAVRPDIDLEMIAQIYALNKKANMDVKDPVMFALIRMEAVKMGWLGDQSEVIWCDADDDALDVLIKDAEEVEAKTEIARTAAFLVPLMAENVFRVSGHHYLSGMSDEYDRKYQTLANATLCANITSILRPSELFHKVLHWVSPAVARRVLDAQQNMETIPNAIRIRANAAPAGTAIVTTTAAVIEAMEASQIAAEIQKYGSFDFSKVTAAAATVRANVTGFHQAYYAYNVAKASASDIAVFESGKAEAIKFAPIAQGFIDAYHQNGALSNARALRKYAEGASVLAKRASRVFKNLSKQDTESIKDLFLVAPEDAQVKPDVTNTERKPAVSSE